MWVCGGDGSGGGVKVVVVMVVGGGKTRTRVHILGCRTLGQPIITERGRNEGETKKKERKEGR